MLSFGFITDNIIELPKGFTLENFTNKLTRELFNYFFDIVEQGCTKFYTVFHKDYTFPAVDILFKISEIAGIEIEIFITYTDKEEFETAQKMSSYKNNKIEKRTNAIIYSEKDNDKLRLNTGILTNSTRELQKFNILMNLVEECSTIVFYCNEQPIEENFYVSSVLKFCENYSINYVNLFGKVL